MSAISFQQKRFPVLVLDQVPVYELRPE
jgi:hypothetical protein